MKKRISLATLGLLAGASTSWAADNADLEKKVEELTRQNRMLLERVIVLEKMMLVGEEIADQGLAEISDEREGQASVEQRLVQVEKSMSFGRGNITGAEGQSLLQTIEGHVDLRGRIEIEAFSTEDFNGNGISDVTLSTIEIGLDARITDWVQAHLLLLYEEGEEDDHLIIDEGMVTLGNGDAFPFYLTMGRMYLPFGSYVSNMVSDSLPLELGEINDAAALVGFQASGFYGSLYAFNGDLREAGKDDKIDAWGASLGFACEKETFTIDVSLDWLNNMGGTEGLGDYLGENIGGDEIDDYVEGLAAHMMLQYGPFDFVTEYVRALEAFAPGEIFFAGSGAKPGAWSIETGMNFNMLARETVFSLSYQATDEALPLSLPEDRYGAAIRMAVLDNITVALEYLHDEDYDAVDGGTGNDVDTATMQMAVEF